MVGRLDATNELGANFIAKPPDHPICALLGSIAVREDHRKFIGKFVAMNIEP